MSARFSPSRRIAAGVGPAFLMTLAGCAAPAAPPGTPPAAGAVTNTKRPAPPDLVPSAPQPAPAGTAPAFELTRENPATMAGPRLADITVLGVGIGQSQSSVRARFAAHQSFIVDVDPANPTVPHRLAIFERLAGGLKGRLFLILLCPAGSTQLSRINVDSNLAPMLGMNLRRLFSSEAFNDTPFRRSFLGAPTRSVVEFEVPSAKLRMDSNIYEPIGLVVSRFTIDTKEHFSFAVVRPVRG